MIRRAHPRAVDPGAGAPLDVRREYAPDTREGGPAGPPYEFVGLVQRT